MSATQSTHQTKQGKRKKRFPPGRMKITAALKTLLEEKEFGSITTAEIARTAGVTEALIYKYFKDKRDLLHQVLAEYLDFFITRAETDVKGIKGALNKLRKLIWSHITMYAHNRVFARILLLEVRNYPEYFGSDAYQMVRRYADFMTLLIEEGQREGSVRDDVPSLVMRQMLLGAIEHVCLPNVLFQRDLDTDQLSDQLCEVIFEGMARPISTMDLLRRPQGSSEQADGESSGAKPG